MNVYDRMLRLSGAKIPQYHRPFILGNKTKDSWVSNNLSRKNKKRKWTVSTSAGDSHRRLRGWEGRSCRHGLSWPAGRTFRTPRSKMAPLPVKTEAPERRLQRPAGRGAVFPSRRVGTLGPYLLASFHHCFLTREGLQLLQDLKYGSLFFLFPPKKHLRGKSTSPMLAPRRQPLPLKS